MEITTITQDIIVHCVTANSFPEGVQQAHETLHNLVDYDVRRKYFGLSWPDQNGIITYKAAAEELQEGELNGHSLETKIISKGDYLFIDLPDFMKDIPAIGIAFQKLIHDDRIAADGLCIEWYLNQNLCRCMVKTK